MLVTHYETVNDARDRVPGEGRPVVMIDVNLECLSPFHAELEGHGCPVYACTPEFYLTHMDVDLLAVVLGPGLPLSRIITLLPQIRRQNDAPIVAFLTDPQPEHLTLLLDAGVDYCFPGPGDGAARLLLSAVAVITGRQRRSQQARSEPVEAGNAQISLDAQTVTRDDSPIPLPLTTTEFRILTLLAQQPGRPLSAVQILREIHGSEYTPAEAREIVEGYALRLRQKLGGGPVTTRPTANAPGQSYRHVLGWRDHPDGDGGSPTVPAFS